MGPEPADVSVVIPAYNASGVVAGAIESVLAQTRRPREIIVVDDGSKDDTPAVVAAFGPAVRCVVQENAGPAAARNRGIAEATSTWVTFLDADDWWMPHRLEAGLGIVERNPHLQWAAGAYTVLLPDNTSLAEPAPGPWADLLVADGYFRDFYEAARAGVPFSTCAMLVKKQVVLDAGAFDPSLKTGEDRDLWYRIADRNPAIGFAKRPLFTYDRRSEGSLTRGAIASHSDDLWGLLQKHVPMNVGPFPWTRSTKAGFFRDEINRAVQHAIRLGERDNVRRLLGAYGEWVIPRNKVLAGIMAVAPQGLWRWLGVSWRRWYDPAQERLRKAPAIGNASRSDPGAAPPRQVTRDGCVCPGRSNLAGSNQE